MAEPSLRHPGEPVVVLRKFNAGLPFYLREPVRLLDVERELSFTPALDAALTIATRDTLRALGVVQSTP